jgi:hypothetical protein
VALTPGGSSRTSRLVRAVTGAGWRRRVPRAWATAWTFRVPGLISGVGSLPSSIRSSTSPVAAAPAANVCSASTLPAKPAPSAVTTTRVRPRTGSRAFTVSTVRRPTPGRLALICSWAGAGSRSSRCRRYRPTAAIASSRTTSTLRGERDLFR